MLGLLLFLLLSPGFAQESVDDRVRAILSGNLILEASQKEAVQALVELGEAGGIAMAKYLGSKVTSVGITLREAYVELGEKASPGLRIGLAGEQPPARRVAMSFLSEIASPTDRALFLSYLEHEDETLRALAARGLVGAATLEDESAETALLAVLDATPPALRKWSALALGTWGGARSVGPLAERLEDESWTVRWDAARGLAELARRGHAAAVGSAVAPRLADPHARTRALAAWVLGQGEIADATPALAARMARETDPVALGYQLEALRSLDPQAPAPALPPELGRHPFVRLKAGSP